MENENEKSLICPCCESKNNFKEWYSISNDYFLLCPSCDNTVQYHEVSDQVNGNFLGLI